MLNMTYQTFGSYITVLVYPTPPSPLECVFRRERGLIILSIFRESSNFDHTLIKNILADKETSQVKKFPLQYWKPSAYCKFWACALGWVFSDLKFLSHI